MDNVRYGKPSMTDLPHDLGRRIINQIMSTSKPDFSETDKMIDDMTKKIIERREREKNES